MTHNRKISVIGLGYVGLSTAVALSKVGRVIAVDISEQRIKELTNHYDRNHELSSEEINSPNIIFTTNFAELKNADFHIITVPTPLDNTRNPNFLMLLDATQKVGQYLKPNDIVVYESSVYPGATEEKCVPVLERSSRLTYGKDFTVGYSPERINPADKEHTFANIIKIISGTDKKTIDILAEVYKSVIKAGVHPVSSIRAAEAAKVIENTQRDVNIAYLNDVVVMLHKLGIDTREVIDAMKTKWNFINFEPGLVGGHCIGINSYYLMYRAEEAGYYSQLIRAVRNINETMSNYIAIETIRNLILLGVAVRTARIAILGLSYKENCSDVRDTNVVNIIKYLNTFGAEVIVHDPIADPVAAKYEYGIDLKNWNEIKEIDAMILAVGHNFYKQLNTKELLKQLKKRCLIMDIKNIFSTKDFENTDVVLWKL